MSRALFAWVVWVCVAFAYGQVCYETVKAVDGYGAPCLGSTLVNLASGSRLVGVSTGVGRQTPCPLCASETGGDCRGWVETRQLNSGNDPSFWVADVWVKNVTCDAIAAIPATKPIASPHLSVVAGDGLCYRTPVTARATVRDEACGTKTITVPADKSLTPEYEYRAFNVCAAVSGSLEWVKVTYTGKPQGSSTNGTWTGWVSTREVIKAPCTDNERCVFRPVQPRQCYRVKTNPVQLWESACSTTTTSLTTLPLGAIVWSVGPDVTPAGCASTTQPWLLVRYDGKVGYIASSAHVVGFACNGDGWLTTAGAFGVEKQDRTAYAGVSYAGTLMEQPNKFLLHTLEALWPANNDYKHPNSLDTQHYWPHFLLGRDKTGVLRVGQYFSLYTSSRALQDGNRDGVIQVEIGAKAARPFTEEDAELTAAVRALYHAVAAYTGMPVCLDSRVHFIEKETYGVNAKQRLAQADFQNATGLVGHQHAYKNGHWDPGQIDPYKLL